MVVMGRAQGGREGSHGNRRGSGVLSSVTLTLDETLLFAVFYTNWIWLMIGSEH